MSRFIKLCPKMRTQFLNSPRFHASKPKLNHQELDQSTEEGITIVSGGVQRLEEVIQSIIARRSAPDWLPFRPGQSYWVPPSGGGVGRGKLIEVVGKVSSLKRWGEVELNKDEVMAVKLSKGWPSSSYFIHDNSPPHPLPMEMEVEVKIFDNPDETDECNSEGDES